MNTKTKGDILAERIEAILNEPNGPESQHRRVIRAVEEYRKPWTLGNSVNGFTLADGQEWHRQDFTEDMLPDGWRPHILGELDRPGDVAICTGGEDFVFNKNITDIPTQANSLHRRTRRPLPAVEKWAEEKAAFARGETIQWRYPNHNRDWIDCTELTPPNWLRDCEYRIKPSPVLVPLGPDDVDAKCEFRYSMDWDVIMPYGYKNCVGLGFLIPLHRYSKSQFESYESMQKNGYFYTRDGGKTWSRCEKEAK